MALFALGCLVDRTLPIVLALAPIAAVAWLLPRCRGPLGRAAAVGAVLATGGVRVAYGWFETVPMRADAQHYAEIGRDFVGWLGQGGADRSPLYAGLVAALLHGSSNGQRVGVAQGVLEAGAALAIVAAGVAVARPWAGIAGAWVHAFNPSAIEAAHQVLTESSAGVAGMVALAATLAVPTLGAPGAAAAGLTVGLSTLIRVNHLLWAAGLAASVLLGAGGPRRRRLAGVALLLGVAGVAVTPLVYRNWSIYGLPVLSSVAGINQSKGSGLPYEGAHARRTIYSGQLANALSPGYEIMVSAGPGCDTQAATYRLLMDSSEVRAVTATDPRQREILVDRALGAAASRQLSQDLAARPLSVLRAWAIKMSDQWLHAYQPQFCYGARPFVSVAVADLYHHVLLALALLGAALLWRDGGPARFAALALVAVAVANTVPSVLTLGLPRYTAPLLPMLAFAAGAGLAGLAAAFGRRPANAT